MHVHHVPCFSIAWHICLVFSAALGYTQTKTPQLSGDFAESAPDADTLRKHPQQEGGGVSDKPPQDSSPNPQQEPFYPNKALADVYGSSLVSSKSEPHGVPFQALRSMGIAFQLIGLFTCQCLKGSCCQH